MELQDFKVLKWLLEMGVSSIYGQFLQASRCPCLKARFVAFNGHQNTRVIMRLDRDSVPDVETIPCTIVDIIERAHVKEKIISKA